MRARCNNPNHSSFENYGGRGVCVATEWNDFFTFQSWALENGYAPGMQIDRQDNDGDYDPFNCRWVTAKVNASNKSNNVVLSAFGETKTVSEWSEDIRCAVTSNTLYQRIEFGWDHEKAIIQPSQKNAKGDKKATFDWYQAVAETTAIYPGKGELMGLVYVSLGLASEAGEVAGKVKKTIRDGDGVLTPEFRKAIISEVADCYWYLALLCTELGMTMGEVAEQNLAKLLDRQDRGVIQGSGDNR